MKFKHIKHDCWKNPVKKHDNIYHTWSCKFPNARHLKYIKMWDYKDEIMFQIKNGHSTKGLRYKTNFCNNPYNSEWYRRISSNRKLIKTMWSLRIKYEKIERQEDSLKSQIEILKSKSRSLDDTIKQISKENNNEN